MITFKRYISESETLKKYVKTDDFKYLKGGIAQEFQFLKAKYPYSGGKLYRGLNFSSPKQYLQFRRSIRDGYIKSDSISSWAKTQSSAKSFAISPQVYVPTSSVLAGYDPDERIHGFIGIIVVVEIGKDVGIDVTKTDYASEDEIILPSGNYKIIDMIVEKKWKHLVNKLDINQEVIDIINKRKVQDRDTLRALFKYKGGDLYDDVKRQIVNNAVDTFINKNTVEIKLNPDPVSKWQNNNKEYNLLFPDGTYSFNLHGSLGMLDFFYLEDAKSYLTNQQRNRIKSNIVDKINKETKKLNNKKVMVNYTHGFNHLCEMFDLKLIDFKYLSLLYANTYNRFNELLRDWNKNRDFNVGEMTKLLKQSMESPFK